MTNQGSVLVLAFALTSSFGGGCNNSHPHGDRDQPKPIVLNKTYSGAYPIRVVCTTGMVADLVRNIGGSRLQLEQLLAADVDPHTHKATADDVTKLSQAELIFYNGLHLEGKMGEIFERLSRKIPAFGVAEYLHPKSIFGDEEDTHDPHVWFDVELWSETAKVVAEVLQKFDPSSKADYQGRLTAYQAKLAELHEYAKKQIATIPREQRVLVTSHDAFRYFGRAYDIEVKGIQGISTSAEASVRDINNLVDFITKRKVKAVFVETSVNPRNMESLMKGCAANGHKVALGGTLFSDAMGQEGTPEETYVGMVRHNVDTIVKALR